MVFMGITAKYIDLEQNSIYIFSGTLIFLIFFAKFKQSRLEKSKRKSLNKQEL